MRWVTNVLVALLPACALSDGNPWGAADLTLSARFDPPASRLVDGALKTNRDDRVQIESLTIGIDSLVLEREGEGATAFDPANPPAGYSLCHNGHCHSDSGDLVDYEDIESAGSNAAPVVSLRGAQGPMPLTTAPTVIPLTVCPNGCALPRGRLTRVVIDIGTVGLRAVVENEQRLPPGGVRIDLELEVEAVVDGVLDIDVDNGEALNVAVDTLLTIPASLLDDVDFSATTTTALEASVRENLVEDTTVDTSVDRFN